jgi:protein-S-isoprenylcysteine O-methyltransferase Ste14
VRDIIGLDPQDNARSGTGGRHLLYTVAGRILPAVVFVSLTAVQVQLLAGDVGVAAQRDNGLVLWLLMVNRLLCVAFSAGIALIYVLRKPPLRGLHDPVALLVSMYGSFILLGLRPLATWLGISGGGLSEPELIGAGLLVVVGSGIGIYALTYLRLNFSILPEARNLTSGGPYRLVRHPVYFGEIVAGLGLAIALASAFALAIWASFVAAQLVRTFREERVLSETLPEYRAFVQKTRHRLIPWIL